MKYLLLLLICGCVRTGGIVTDLQPPSQDSFGTITVEAVLERKCFRVDSSKYAGVCLGDTLVYYFGSNYWTEHWRKR